MLFTINSIPYNNQFLKSLFWNLFDSLVTQALLIIHHIMVRSFIGGSFHGTFGYTLSLFYFCIILFNFGLDYSLAAHFKELTKNRQSLLYLFKFQLIPQILFLIFCAFIFYFLYPVFFSQNNFFNFNLALIISVTFVTESIKKTVKTFLQLAFASKVTAIVESVGMYIYMLLIWFGYFIGLKFSLNYCWLLLSIVSAAQMTILVYTLYKYYLSLPNLSNSNLINLNYLNKTNLCWRICKSRFFNWSIQCSLQFFSSNFLVPFCALYVSTDQVSLLKISSSITQWVSIVINKALGASGDALLANTKYFSRDIRLNLFSYLSFILHQALYVMSIFIIINISKINYFYNPVLQANSKTGWLLLYFLVFIIIIESFFTFYQKWFILEEKSNYFAAISLISILLSYIIYYLNIFNSISLLLFSVILIRLIGLFFLSFVTFKYWGIPLNLRPNSKVVFISILASSLFYLFF